MGKSIRSKRKKRLRTLKREIVEPHYDAKDVAKLAIAAAAMAAPKIELPKRKEDMEDDSRPTRGRSKDAPQASSGGSPISMAVDGEPLTTSTPSNLKAKGGIRKRGKSKSGHRSKQIVKSKKKKQLQF
ncbi:hypothetical protein R1sor_021983 [Riccia sorocarpa]|uniref:Uncharacterized protein n=1 Tax=Riccia sorocarpa TaxID=122646 RepID=A0ABD3GLJ9_9MARC